MIPNSLSYIVLVTTWKDKMFYILETDKEGKSFFLCWKRQLLGYFRQAVFEKSKLEDAHIISTNTFW